MFLWHLSTYHIRPSVLNAWRGRSGRERSGETEGGEREEGMERDSEECVER